MLLLEWLCIIFMGTFAFTALSVLFVDLNYHPEPNVDFTPWKDLIGMYQLAPIGWALMGLIGPLWLALAGLFITLKTRNRLWHTLTIVGTMIFGYLWPGTFWAWMSV